MSSEDIIRELDEVRLACLQKEWKFTNSIFNTLDGITQELADMNLYEFMDYLKKVEENVDKAIQKEGGVDWLKS